MNFYFKQSFLKYSRNVVPKFRSTVKQKEKNTALLDSIDNLNSENNQLKAEISLLNKKNAGKVHNERNAGRKPRIDENTAALIQMYRAQGKTIKEIAEITSLSVGSVHKHCNSMLNSKVK